MPPLPTIDEPLTVIDADEHHWREYCELAARSYGQPIADITALYDHTDTRVAVRGGRVVAGGIGMLIPQFFGGRPVPSACMALGCVAPEERGSQLAVHMLTERTRPLQEQGAVLTTLWTTSTGYAHRAGWEAPVPVFTWSLPTDELKRSFDNGTVVDTEVEGEVTAEVGAEVTVAHGTSPDTAALQRELAARWNGPLLRPHWWDPWKQHKLGLVSYRFHRRGHRPAGLLSMAFTDHPTEGTRIVVHDFAAADHDIARAMFAFLGRHNSRVQTVEFQRTGLPPHPQLPHHLRRAGAGAAHVRHPWMLRVLDLQAAIRLRGWPAHLDLTLPLEIDTDHGGPGERFTLRIVSGAGELVPSTRAGRVRLTRRQFAVWYSGGYRTVTAAAMAGVLGDPTDLTSLVGSTAEREPWLPDHF